MRHGLLILLLLLAAPAGLVLAEAPQSPAPLDPTGPMLPAMRAIADALVQLSQAQLGMFVLGLILFMCVFEGLWAFLRARNGR